MKEQRSPMLKLRARGPLACFTRPELKVERFSYPVITPSAARGLIEAVLWKPAIFWRIERIKVLKEIKFTAFRRNEVNSKALKPSRALIAKGGPPPVYYADEDRAQRNTVALSDVDYVIETHFVMTRNAGSGDNINKFIDMFTRRLAKGQYFHHPYFGCREFVADILPADDYPRPIDETKELGLMLWDIDFRPKLNVPIFFPARLEQGVMEVPQSRDELFVRVEEGGSA